MLVGERRFMPSFPRTIPRICVALGFPSIAELSKAAEREQKDGTTFFEFRLDHLPDPSRGIDLIRKFERSNPDISILATCRHKQNGGGFAGSLQQQLAVLEDAAKAGATAVDLEVEAAETLNAPPTALRKLVPVIVSYHNFESTPALLPVLKRLKRIEADAYKIATTARKPTDNLRVLQFARDHAGEPLIALAMSEVGIATRVLTPSLGCLFTYAAPTCANGTAAGQMPAKMMRALYRADKLTKQSRVYGVIADPVSHSKSPIIHNRAFQSKRIDAVYLPFLVSGNHLGDWMKLAAELPVAGFSVTIPHKQKIIRYLDVVEPLAKRIGAVNTVLRKGGKWRGTNTDTEGVLKPLAKHVRLAHASVLIAGYGGAARAAAVALADAGSEVTITGRDSKSAAALANVVKAESLTLEQAARRHFDALVHATPVGMSPASDGILFKDNIPADVVLDMVYNPHETLLLKRAKEQGCSVIHGSEMLLEQAACQFEIWTGESAPRSVMKNAFEQYS
jgi:3-dehydroquinate dehydratase/shikimate dehydrogenase